MNPISHTLVWTIGKSHWPLFCIYIPEVIVTTLDFIPGNFPSVDLPTHTKSYLQRPQKLKFNKGNTMELPPSYIYAPSRPLHPVGSFRRCTTTKPSTNSAESRENFYHKIRMSTPNSRFPLTKWKPEGWNAKSGVWVRPTNPPAPQGWKCQSKI